jgi:hypothetical protein
MRQRRPLQAGVRRTRTRQDQAGAFDARHERVCRGALRRYTSRGVRQRRLQVAARRGSTMTAFEAHVRRAAVPSRFDRFALSSVPPPSCRAAPVDVLPRARQPRRRVRQPWRRPRRPLKHVRARDRHVPAGALAALAHRAPVAARTFESAPASAPSRSPPLVQQKRPLKHVPGRAQGRHGALSAARPAALLPRQPRRRTSGSSAGSTAPSRGPPAASTTATFEASVRPGPATFLPARRLDRPANPSCGDAYFRGRVSLGAESQRRGGSTMECHKSTCLTP